MPHASDPQVIPIMRGRLVLVAERYGTPRVLLPTPPWYPSARLFRQRGVGEWEPVFGQMAAELQELVARRRMEAA